MKTKNLNKKLQLKKNTVSRLDATAQKHLKGGICTCLNTGCATYVWQNCEDITNCGCPTIRDPECFLTVYTC